MLVMEEQKTARIFQIEVASEYGLSPIRSRIEAEKFILKSHPE